MPSVDRYEIAQDFAMTAEKSGMPLKCTIWSTRKRGGRRFPRVLVVDDYADTVNVTSMVLALDGFEAQVAYRGNAAVDAATRWQPQAVLLDICMPDMSGLEVAARLRAMTSTSETVLIAHSALASDADLARAKESGFDAFCAKPTDAMKLSPFLRHFVDPAAE
ncbi:response regulator receiver protein [Caballeronia terrestris]|jgi:CheY-like chemotaxis protein|uniref:Response regulator receiver protein n=1 Tax=Caballeronia terrestris TaxID=1226301 RepID=A0A158K985_9BURK|nr:response regulator [Caballeronia terrestris]SAL77349.1 response regulator receiver protein [Caballeronia terrestris]